MLDTAAIPDPALVVLVGASGAGKSTWAAGRYRATEIVGSDALRAVMGSGPADMGASVEAMDVLDRIVAARARRRLTVVIDSTGLERDRRLGYLAQARAAGVPAVAVLFETDPAVCRRRNTERDRSVPARVLTAQLRAVRELGTVLADEGWDVVHRVVTSHRENDPAEPGETVSTSQPEPTSSDGFARSGLQVILQVSRFAWGSSPGPWLRDLALAAEQVGFSGLALMDHLIQIPQVGRAWEPIPEPWVSLGFLAGLDTGLRLGTLVSPVTFRDPGIIAKTVATLDAVSGGRAFCGLGAGWWAREHAAYGLAFPTDRERLDQLQVCIETLRALWAPGTKPYRGRYVNLPETTCYPRPEGRIPILVGGSGPRVLRIVAEQADGCNVRTTDDLPATIELVRRRCVEVQRDPAELEITVLDVAVIGTDRDDVARRVERLRGPIAAPVFAARHHAGSVRDHIRRYRELADLGVSTVFCALPDLAGAEDLERCRPLLEALPR